MIFSNYFFKPSDLINQQYYLYFLCFLGLFALIKLENLYFSFQNYLIKVVLNFVTLLFLIMIAEIKTNALYEMLLIPHFE